MANSNKILTVSYGTFSCTLEGFEDSFGTMKEIAEYFRDLAADDRYFGAEPPQPDAEMLARIAEKEVTRQVRSRQEPHRIVLRATDYQPAEEAPAPAPKPAPKPAAAKPAAVAPVAEAPAGDSIAAKLQRIRAVVSENPTTQGLVEDPDAEAPLAADIGDLTAALDIDDATMALEAAADDLDASAEISTTLDRIQAGANDAYDEVYEEDEPVSVATLARAQEDFVLEDDSLLAEEDSAEEDSAEDIEADEDAVADAGAEDLDLSRILSEEDKEPAAAAPSGLFSDIGEDDNSFEDDDDDEIVNILGEDENGGAPRLLKLRRAELDAAIAAGDIEEVEEDEPEAATLSPEQEADLARELASVLEGDEDEEAPEEDERPARAFGQSESGADVSRLMADAEKRMDEPESSSSRAAYSALRAAVAVAKAEKSAGKDLDADATDDAYRDDLANAVRPRRPVTGADAPRPERPADGSRPAPLKLVAEQRIDLEDGMRGPVRPRRLSQEVELDDDEQDDDNGFAQYAKEQGVTELPQLLEAAAAYLSFVEGQEQFSRPQLMRKLRQVENQEFNREDGLRTFGQLLRDGKIEKTGGGRFTASDDIGFRPDRRAAG